MVFNEESMLQEKSEMEDKTQGGAPNSSVDTQKKGVEFSESPKRPDGSNENFRFRWRRIGGYSRAT